jgi:GTPase Era involved in 16S rRNA processing
MSNPYKKLEKRSIIVVGKTGAGKSKFLNELMKNNYFKSSANTQSCTNKVECSEWHLVKCKFEFKNQTQEMPYQLMSYDTPGIADSQGRSKEFLNEIAQTIKTTPLNLIIILVEYGKLDTGFYNNIEILRECLNDLSQSSSMLVVNKVPTQKNLDRKRKKGEEVKDREIMLKEIFEKLSECLGSEFKFKLFLENDDMDDAETFNAEQYDLIRQVIYSRSSHLNASQVKTWQEIVEFYTKSIENDQMLNVQTNELKVEIENKLEKIEFDIADLKYPFLVSNNEKAYDEKEVEFVENFECKITRERYESLTGFHLDGSLMPGFLRKTESIVKSFLEIADVQLSIFQRELEKLDTSNEEKEKMLKQRKEKITRLKNSLANPNQFN